jgi:putative transposase
MRKAMVDPESGELSVRRQCELLGVNRNWLVSPGRGGLGEQDLALARRIDELHLRFPEFGARRMSQWLLREGQKRATRRRVAHGMKAMGLAAIYRRPRTSQSRPGAPIYPYLLRDREVKSPDEAWCADVTYIPMARGFAYLVAVMDWKTRAVLSWRLSNTLDGTFCVEALREAMEAAGRAPEIINTDQGCQFTSRAWIATVQESGAKVSMDGKGRWMDNVFIERLWRSVKHEGVYLWAHENVRELEIALAKWFADYNHWKPPQALGYKTPWQCYRPEQTPTWREAA